MSVDRAQIEHLRSFVATPRCMSYETIRSLGDILDNLEAASAEVAALRRQVEELQAGKRSGIVTSWGYTSETPRRMIATVSANDRAPSVDVVTVKREDLARAMCRGVGSDPEAHEPGSYPVKDGEDRGEAWHYRWRDFSDTADREFCALRSGEAGTKGGSSNA